MGTPTAATWPEGLQLAQQVNTGAAGCKIANAMSSIC